MEPSSSKPPCCGDAAACAAPPPRHPLRVQAGELGVDACRLAGRVGRRRRRFGDAGRRCPGGARARGRHAGGGWPHRADVATLRGSTLRRFLASRAQSVTLARPPRSSTLARRVRRAGAAKWAACGFPSRPMAPRRRATITIHADVGNCAHDRRAAVELRARRPVRPHAAGRQPRADGRLLRLVPQPTACRRAGERRRRRHLCRRLARPLPRPGAHARRLCSPSRSTPRPSPPSRRRAPSATTTPAPHLGPDCRRTPPLRGAPPRHHAASTSRRRKLLCRHGDAPSSAPRHLRRLGDARCPVDASGEPRTAPLSASSDGGRTWSVASSAGAADFSPTTLAPPVATALERRTRRRGRVLNMTGATLRRP